MDFEKILRVARKNELTKKEPVKCLQTKFKPPTKEQHEKDKLLSEGVQRFLARKEEEEKRKQKEAERRKLELMALRAKDPKANKRIQTMLKRTKSANKSVMEDAIDNNNTADTLAGPSQPDEDDYGFVSELSSQLYNKLIQKMYSTPSNDSPKFSPSKKPSSSNLSNTKERVKMALLRQEEEDKLPHRKKRKLKDKKDEDDDIPTDYVSSDREINKSIQETSKEKIKIKKNLPPPVDFHELLKIAEQKQHEPIVFEPKIVKSQEPEVLMTKKQKLEHEKMLELKRQREMRLQNLESAEKSGHNQENKKSIPKIPKINQSNSEQKVLTSQKKVNGQVEKSSNSKTNSSKSFDKSDRTLGLSKSKELSEKNNKIKSGPDKKSISNNNNNFEKKNKIVDDETSRLIKERDEALKLLKEKERLIKERDEAVRILKEKEQLIKERDEVVRKLKLLEESEKTKKFDKSNAKNVNGTALKCNSMPKKVAGDKSLSKVSDGSKSNLKSDSSINSSKSNSVLNKSAQNQKSNLKYVNKNVPDRQTVREFPPKDVRPAGKFNNLPSRNFPRNQKFPPGEVRRKGLMLKKRCIESDDEYDSELDDFIDDDTNDMESEEVSKVISEIFRYDKNKYSKYDEMDDECMESNFAQISKEEFFSTKCGILEDLQDIQREKAKSVKKQKR